MEPFAGANALPCGARIKTSLLAKDDVNNVGAGRAAKGANPVIRTTINALLSTKAECVLFLTFRLVYNIIIPNKR